MELTSTYTVDDFCAYANAAYERVVGKGIVTSQSNFMQDQLNYIADHYIPLDRQQLVSVSAGASHVRDGYNSEHRPYLRVGPPV